MEKLYTVTKNIGSCPILRTLWTAAHLAPVSMGFFQARILVWVAISDLPNPGIEPTIDLLHWQADSTSAPPSQSSR